MDNRKSYSSQQSDVWARQRTSAPTGDSKPQNSPRGLEDETPRCYMCGLKGEKEGKAVDAEDNRQIRPRRNRCKAWCKFHMLKNPWSEHVTPAETYNPVWTGIPYSRPSSRPGQTRSFGGETTLQEEGHVLSGSSSSPSTTELGKSKFYIFYDKDLSHDKCNEKCRQNVNNRSKISSVPPAKRDPSLYEKTQDKEKSSKYCFGCEKALVYKLFTETLKIKREVEEAKYRSKDNHLKYNLKVRKGTTPVHAYWPTKTWDADHWPLLPTTEAREKLKFTNQSKEVLQHPMKKQVLILSLENAKIKPKN